MTSSEFSLYDPSVLDSTNIDDNSFYADPALTYTSQDVTNANVDTGVTDALDLGFKVAGGLQQLGVIGMGSSTSQAVQKQNGTIQPTGANQVYQNTASTTVPSFLDKWIIKLGMKPSTGTRLGVGAGALVLAFVGFKLVKKAI